MSFHPSRGPSAQPSCPESSAERPPHVLLIEDDDAMRDMLAEALRQEGYAVTECESVFRWLQFAISEAPDAACAQHGVYDLVISDIRVPIMTGMEVLQTLSEAQFTVARLPTILITAFGDDETHQEARRLGAAAVLDKPFDPAELIALAQAILKT